MGWSSTSTSCCLFVAWYLISEAQQELNLFFFFGCLNCGFNFFIGWITITVWNKSLHGWVRLKLQVLWNLNLATWLGGVEWIPSIYFIFIGSALILLPWQTANVNESLNRTQTLNIRKCSVIKLYLEKYWIYRSLRYVRIFLIASRLISEFKAEPVHVNCLPQFCSIHAQRLDLLLT